MNESPPDGAIILGVTTFILIFLIAGAVGVLGSMLGIGGGVIIIPLLTLLFGVDIRLAIGASIVSVIATSTAAGAVYVGHGMTHIRLGMILEIVTALGALAGGITAVLISPRYLYALFTLVMLYVVYSMGKLPKDEGGYRRTGLLDTQFIDPVTGKLVRYGVKQMPVGMVASFIGGNISGLLGIGGGIIKVPIMAVVMGMPLKASIATSNFMIGVTAATSGMIYYGRGYIDPSLAVPTALGVLVGAQLGPRVARRTKTQTLKRIFQLLLFVLALQMAYKAITLS